MTHYIFLSFLLHLSEVVVQYVQFMNVTHLKSQTQSFDAKEHAPSLPEHEITSINALTNLTSSITCLQPTMSLDKLFAKPMYTPIDERHTFDI